jgi:hypothetical protein
MKKSDLIHVTLVIVAILLGYSALEYLLGALSLFSRLADISGSRIVYDLVLTALFAVACLALIRNSRKITEVLLKDEPETADASRWDLDRRNILFVLFIGLGTYILLQAVAYAISDLYDTFSNQVNPSTNDRVTIRNGLLIQLLRAIMGFLLIYGAGNLTNLIERTIAGKLRGGSKSS